MNPSPVTDPKPTSTDDSYIFHQFQEEFCFAYLLADHASHRAVLVDPRADQVDVYLRELAERELELDTIIETHTHADHLSGAAELRRRTKAEIAVSANAHSEVATLRLEDGNTVTVGALRIEVIASPGHTDDSLSLHVGDTLLTGDALLVGGAGRTDFQNGSPEALHSTLHERFQDLPGNLLVYPGHDYAGHRHSTLARERETNPLYKLADRAEFVRALRAAKQPKPRDMDAYLRANIRGLKPVGSVAVERLSARLRSATPPLLVDVRTPAEYRHQHIDGSRLAPLEKLDDHKGEIPSDRDLVVVCRTGARARLAATRLEAKSVEVLDGGLVAWQEAGLPIVAGKKHMSLERQVRIAAGAMATAGGILAVTTSPLFGLVPAFVGLGLVFAGVTDNCGMALVLAKAPWNQVEEEPAGGTCAAAVAGCAAELPGDPR